MSAGSLGAVTGMVINDLPWWQGLIILLIVLFFVWKFKKWIR